MSVHKAIGELGVLLLFRVVGYLPGTGTQTTITHGLRAGVAQASREETADHTTGVVCGRGLWGFEEPNADVSSPAEAFSELTWPSVTSNAA